jgi:HD-GYP domain-containing protein (c-di-GMP phosphodiesterase class II)
LNKLTKPIFFITLIFVFLLFNFILSSHYIRTENTPPVNITEVEFIIAPDYFTLNPYYYLNNDNLQWTPTTLPLYLGRYNKIIRFKLPDNIPSSSIVNFSVLNRLSESYINNQLNHRFDTFSPRNSFHSSRGITASRMIINTSESGMFAYLHLFTGTNRMGKLLYLNFHTSNQVDFAIISPLTNTLVSISFIILSSMALSIYFIFKSKNSDILIYVGLINLTIGLNFFTATMNYFESDFFIIHTYINEITFYLYSLFSLLYVRSIASNLKLRTFLTHIANINIFIIFLAQFFFFYNLIFFGTFSARFNHFGLIFIIISFLCTIFASNVHKDPYPMRLTKVFKFLIPSIAIISLYQHMIPMDIRLSFLGFLMLLIPYTINVIIMKELFAKTYSFKKIDLDLVVNEEKLINLSEFTIFMINYKTEKSIMPNLINGLSYIYSEDVEGFIVEGSKDIGFNKIFHTDAFAYTSSKNFLSYDNIEEPSVIFSKNSCTLSLKTSENLNLIIYITKPLDFNEFDKNIAEIFLSNLINFSKNFSIISSIQNNKKHFITFVGILLDRRNGYRSNSITVSKLMEVLMQSLGYEASELENISIASHILDIGILSIDDDLCTKDLFSLTPEEYAIFSSHAEYGIEILSTFNNNIMPYTKEMLLDYYENFDGSGKTGKSGDDINILSRLARLCYNLDSYFHAQKNSPNYTFNDCMKYFKSRSGTVYDPQLIEILIKEKETVRSIINLRVN